MNNEDDVNVLTQANVLTQDASEIAENEMTEDEKYRFAAFVNMRDMNAVPTGNEPLTFLPWHSLAYANMRATWYNPERKAKPYVPDDTYLGAHFFISVDNETGTGLQNWVMEKQSEATVVPVWASMFNGSADQSLVKQYSYDDNAGRVGGSACGVWAYVTKYTMAKHLYGLVYANRGAGEDTWSRHDPHAAVYVGAFRLNPDDYLLGGIWPPGASIYVGPRFCMSRPLQRVSDESTVLTYHEQFGGVPRVQGILAMASTMEEIKKLHFKTQ